MLYVRAVSRTLSVASLIIRRPGPLQQLHHIPMLAWARSLRAAVARAASSGKKDEEPLQVPNFAIRALMFGYCIQVYPHTGRWCPRRQVRPT